jgi:hypothetical protein
VPIVAGELRAERARRGDFLGVRHAEILKTLDEFTPKLVGEANLHLGFASRHHAIRNVEQHMGGGELFELIARQHPREPRPVARRGVAARTY